VNKFKKTNTDIQEYTKDIDKVRVANESNGSRKKKSTELKKPRIVKRTVQQTIPYERVVSEYVFLVESNVKIGKQIANLYSKTYFVPDINYSSATKKEQEEMLLQYMDLLNGFDSSASVEITIHNNKINKKDFEKEILLKEKNDELEDARTEFNGILHDNLMLGQNGIRCKKYITVTVIAIDLDTAQSRFLNYEAHLNVMLKKLDTELVPLRANERIRLLADVFRDVNTEITPISREEFSRGSEKQHCCPDYFEFKRDYFMFNNKYARCIYFEKLPPSIRDDLFKDIVETNLNLLISKHVAFVEPEEALKLVRKQLTDMKMEEIVKTRKIAEHSAGAFVDPIEGTPLAENMAHAKEFLDDLQSRNQKMTLCQFVIMIIGESFDELEANTEKVEIILRKASIKPNRAPYRQEQCLSSVLPIGNAKLKVRRTLSSESTAVFMPFNSREITHEGGLYYGLNRMTKNIIVFDRRRLNNPNGFFLGVPGSGKSFAAKMEMILSILSTTDEILIVATEPVLAAPSENILHLRKCLVVK
jgi:hypothetical protein